MPVDRFDPRLFDDRQPGAHGMVAARLGGFLDDVEGFDAAFFGIAPREAHLIDPQHRLLLETAWEALEDAGIPAQTLAGSRTGVYVGLWTHDYERLAAPPHADVDLYSTTGTGRYAASGRISYALDLRGPSLTIDTACSSSLVAVHLACQSLRAGECSAAIVGAANLILDPLVSVAYSRSGLLSRDGLCRFGDRQASGYVRSEGVGAVVLKPLARALEDGDRVRAVIRGSAVNNDGRGSGLLVAPSVAAQTEMLRTAYEGAGVDLGRLQYIEAHGTGTQAGDPVELHAIAQLMGQSRRSPVLVGSAKTNIGHAEAASGMAGVIKVVMALERGVIPASLHFDEPNPALPWHQLPVQVCSTATPWQVSDGSRLAGVSAYGITGTNAHVIIEQAPTPQKDSPRPEVKGRAHLIALSARSTETLRVLATRWQTHDWHGCAFSDAAYTASVRRFHESERMGVVANGFEELRDRLGARVADGGRRKLPAPPSVVFVFPGQGSQWIGMGRQLLESEPAARETLEACDAAIATHGGFSVRELIEHSNAEALSDIGCIQPLLFAVEVMLARVWMSWGIRPGACLGHSMGEVAAAHIAGALSLDDAARIICTRSGMLRQKRGLGGMALIDAPREDTERLLTTFANTLSVGVINGPRSTVVSGERREVEALLTAVEAHGLFGRAVKVDVASHSAMMDDLLDPLKDALVELRPRRGERRLYSTVTGEVIDGESLRGVYWARNLREPVQFARACESARRDGHNVFLEISPHPILTSSMLDNDQADALLVLPSLHRDGDERRAMLDSLAEMYEAGCSVRWGALHREDAHVVSLPAYPWQRERFWHDLRGQTPEDFIRRNARAAEIGDASAAVFEVTWKAAALSGSANQRGSWLILSSDRQAETQLVDAARASGIHTFCARSALERARHSDSDFTVRRGSVDDLQWVLSQCGATRVVYVVPQRGNLDEAWPSVESALRDGAGDLLAALRGVRREGASEPTQLWTITQRAQRVGSENVDPVPAALAGLIRVAWDEYPTTTGGLIDVSPGVDATTAPLVVQEIASGQPREVALRQGLRYVRTLKELPGRAPTRPSLLPDGSYLITGGLGGVGLVLATHLAQCGARHLVLAVRQALPPRETWSSIDDDSDLGRRVRGVEALERLGARVRIVPMDVGDDRAIRGLIELVERELPPLKGVIHAAMTVESALLDTLTADDVVGNTRVKGGGAWSLYRLLNQTPLDFFICCSSVFSVVGFAGVAAYAVANALVDAVIDRCVSDGWPAARSINWAGWQDIGQADAADTRRTLALLAQDGIRSFEVAAGVNAFDVVLSSKARQALVASIDADALVNGGRRRTQPDLFAGICAGSPLEERSHQKPSAPALRESVLAVPPAKRQDALARGIQQELGAVLRLVPERIGRATPLGTFGLDSLMGVELRRRLERLTGLTLPATLVWSYPTVDALAAHLLDRLSPSEAALLPDAVAVPIDAALQQMSDAEALAELLRTGSTR
jgi:acyl transferase domain-containing protein